MSEPHDRKQTLQKLLSLYSQRRWVECEQEARLALKASPDDGFIWKALGAAFAAQGKHADAIHAKERAVALWPGDVEALLNLANSYSAGGRLVDAARCRERVCSLEPDSAQRLNEWGTALREAQLMPEARVVYEKALAISPKFGEALSNLANTLADLGQPAEAERRYRDALEVLPREAVVYNNLGNLLKNQGRHADAMQCYRAAMELNPDFAGGHSNYLLALNHVPGVTARQIKQASQAFGRWATARAGRVAHMPRETGAPLRVGFVTGDLRSHPVGYFLEGVLAHWPHDVVQLHAYPTLALEDALTQRVRPRFAQWRPISHMDDAKAAGVIAADRIDVLVDLSGHTAHNRLPLFAWRPAPVQATWLGYFATTGIEQVDWVLADAISIAPGEEDRFTEKVWRLPGSRLCFTPPADAPGVSALPAAANGSVTFGSFQNLGKINDGVLALWSRVMSQLPGSRLRVQNAQLGDDESRREFAASLARNGIDVSRVAMHGRSSRMAYLKAHEEVDLILDTFPYPGGTTTCEALWMGVPTVTLTGDSMLARQGESLLAAAGLVDWVGRSADDFVNLAVRKASDLRGLAELRAALRARLPASALFDAQRFARELSQAFLRMSGRP